MSVYPLDMVTTLPPKLNRTGAGMTLNEASAKESVQTTGLPVTEMESFVKTS